MPRGYHGPEDPEKGMPHRHTRAKIELLLTEPDLPTYEQLLAVIMKVAEKRPEDVLDAVTAVVSDDGRSGEEGLHHVTRHTHVHAHREAGAPHSHSHWHEGGSERHDHAH